MTMTYTMQPSLSPGVMGLYAANIQNMHGINVARGGITGMGSVIDNLIAFATKPGDLGTNLTDKFKQVAGNLKTTAAASGVDLTGDLLKAACNKLRPAAAAKLGKSVEATTDEDVLAYMSGLPTQQLTTNLTAIAKEKADQAMYLMAGVGVVVAAALYFGLRGRKSGGAVKSNGRRRKSR